MEKYKIKYCDDFRLDATLKKETDDTWELVRLSEIVVPMSNRSRYTLIFRKKKRLPEQY